MPLPTPLQLKGKSVIVIGAGPGGLWSAQELKKLGLDNVTVVEARNRLGGRIMNSEESPQHKGFAPQYPVELGPEFIHGDKENLLLDFIREKGVKGKPVKLLQLAWPNYFYFGKEGRLVSGKEAEGDKELTKMFDVFEMTEGLDADLIPEENLLQYMARMGTPSRVLDMADAIMANDYGAEMSQIGLKETVHEQNEWKYGEDYLVLDGCTMSEVVAEMAKGLNVKMSWKVKEVRYGSGGGKVRVIRDNGEELTADAVVVAVPLPILRDKDIAFDPPLSEAKAQASSLIRTGNAVKVVARVNKKFWPDDTWDVVCSDSFIPELWLTPAARCLAGEKMESYYWVGFVSGERADRLRRLPQAEVNRKMLLQLDAIFGSTENKHPASDACTGFLIADWGLDALAKGAYTHPALGAHGQRPILAAPEGSKLFFVGEATQEGCNPCIQAAMETGARGALEVVSSLATLRARL